VQSGNLCLKKEVFYQADLTIEDKDMEYQLAAILDIRNLSEYV
jgi:hypothetical protein